MISQFGIIGAAIATVISLFVFAFLLLKRSLKEIGSTISEVVNLVKILKLLATSIIIGGLLFLVKKSIADNLLALVIYAGVFFPLTYYLIYKQGLLSVTIIDKIMQKFKL